MQSLAGIMEHTGSMVVCCYYCRVVFCLKDLFLVPVGTLKLQLVIALSLI